MKKLVSVLMLMYGLIASASAQTMAALTVGDFMSQTETRKFLDSQEGRNAGIVRNPPPSTHVGLIRVASSALNAAEVQVDLPDGNRAVYLTTKYPSTPDDHSGVSRWEGRLKSETIDGHPRQLANIRLISAEDASTHATVTYIAGFLMLGDDTYEIIGLSKDIAAIIKYDRNVQRKLHPDGWDEFQKRRKEIEKRSQANVNVEEMLVAASAAPVLRVLFAITPSAAPPA